MNQNKMKQQILQIVPTKILECSGNMNEQKRKFGEKIRGCQNCAENQNKKQQNRMSTNEKYLKNL